MLDRTKSPTSETIADPSFPEAEKWILPSGIPVIWLARDDQPVIMLDLVIPMGRFHEDYPGLLFFMARMLQEGTRKMSSGEIAENLDFHGSQLEIRPTLDHIFVKLYCLKRFFKSQCQLLRELLTQSTFPEREFEKIKNIRLNQIRQQHAKTNAYAGLKFREEIFGKRHPYGQMITLEDVQNTRVEQVKWHFEKGMAKPQIFIAGDVGQEELKIVEETFENIEFSDYAETKHVMNSTVGSQHISWERSVQSSIRLGHSTIGYNHPEVHDLRIASDFLGGYFGSRLMKNIREEKGLTYGIGSSIVHLNHGSYWTVGTDVLKEKVGLAVSEIKKEIIALQHNTPAAEEVEAFKNYLKGKWLMSFDSCFNSLNLIMQLELSGLTTDHWRSFIKAINDTQPEHISAAAKKFFNTELLCEVLVG